MGDDRLTAARDLAAAPGFGELFGALRMRLEAGGTPATVTLPALSDQARTALADLLGLDGRPGLRPRVRITDIDEALRTSRVGLDLRETLEALGGPLADRRAERDADRAAWDEVWAQMHGTAQPRDRAWLDDLRTSGIAARLAGSPNKARDLLTDAVAVVARLPARAIGLGVLAAEVTGDAHALDRGRPLATLVLRWAARATDRDAVPVAARDWRQLWADVGVVCDAVSASVLVMGLRPEGDGLLARTLRDHAAAGAPARITLRHLGHETLALSPTTVFVCENPAVAATAADRLGARCAPLVCVEGMPDTAADRLLHQLRATGCTIAFHADFDWGGLSIGNVLVDRHDARPWRFTSDEYAMAVAHHAGTTLPPRAVEARWDPYLGDTLRRRGRRVLEEHVLDDLLNDLAVG